MPCLLESSGSVKPNPLSCPPISRFTAIVSTIAPEDPQAAEKLLPLVSEELRSLAASKLARESPGQTLQATALVHEAWLRLTGGENLSFANRAHFFASAAEAMRRILIDRARKRAAIRHGSGNKLVPFEETEIMVAAPDDRLLEVNDALEKLVLVNRMEAELVKLRYFIGMTLAEAAAVLGISTRTADKYWAHARAWLYREIQSQAISTTKNPGEETPGCSS